MEVNLDNDDNFVRQSVVTLFTWVIGYIPIHYLT